MQDTTNFLEAPLVSNPIHDKKLLEQDEKLVNDFVKDELFHAVKFIYEPKEDLEVGGDIYGFFVKTCGQKVGEGRLSTERLRKSYLEVLWTRVISRDSKGRGNHQKDTIPKMLSNKRSGVMTLFKDNLSSKC